MKVRLDHGGMAEILKSGPVRAAIRARAEVAAESVRNSGTVQRRGIADRVEVEDYTTDRAAVAVTLTHPAASGMQAKYGIFSRAAADAGIEYRSKEG
jgi:hypothetical protein